MKLSIYRFQQGSLEEVKIPDVFILDKVNRHLIWEIITTENANLRQGTHKTKTRGEVRGGGKKPWRQKGTGHARAGSNRSPIWVGGGTTFGPRPKSYRKGISPKKKRAGYRNIMAQKIKDEKVILFDDIGLEKISTKDSFQKITSLLTQAPFYEAYIEGGKLRKNTNRKLRKVSLVLDTEAPEIKKSVRNIPWVQFLHADRLSGRGIFYNHGLLIAEKAFKKISKNLSK